MQNCSAKQGYLIQLSELIICIGVNLKTAAQFADFNQDIPRLVIPAQSVLLGLKPQTHTHMPDLRSNGLSGLKAMRVILL